MVTFSILMWLWAGMALFMAKKGDLDREINRAYNDLKARLERVDLTDQ